MNISRQNFEQSGSNHWRLSNSFQFLKSRDMQTEKKTISVEKCKDSGLALVLVCLICFLAWKQPFFLLSAIGLLLVAMTYPPIFKPFARLWFALSMALGAIVSRIILTAIFFLIVCPVALLRRLMGKDPMQVKSWKKGRDSIFRRRDHRYGLKDLEHPY